MKNIFEFLGLPSDHRPVKKIYQLVKHFDDVNPKAEQGIFHKKVSFPMFGQVKRDGVFCAIVVMDGAVGIFNRTGKHMTSCGDLHSSIVQQDLVDGVYMGELQSLHKCSLEELSGVVTPERVNPLKYTVEEDGTIIDQPTIAKRIYVDFFDFLSLNEFVAGVTEVKYRERHMRLKLRTEYTNLHVLPYVIIKSEEELRDFAQQMIDLGEEGAVFKQDVGYKCGAKDWHQMKVVRGIHVDLECIGWEEGTGKYLGRVANLLFRYKNGKTVTAMLGKGWTHEDAREMRIHIGGYPHFCNGSKGAVNPIGRIFHVYGLQPSSKNGIIRLPKVAEQRHDKAQADY